MRYTVSDIRTAQRPPWRLNKSLLEVLAVVVNVGHYFNSNSTPDSDTRVVWEAHKVVIRGVLIKHGSRLKRQRTAQLNSLLHKLQTLELTHKQTPTRQLGIELDTVRTQVTDLLHFKAKAALQICRKKIGVRQQMRAAISPSTTSTKASILHTTHHIPHRTESFPTPTHCAGVQILLQLPVQTDHDSTHPGHDIRKHNYFPHALPTS